MKETSILIVDDDADAREMLRIALQTDGYRVLTADSVRAALDCLRSSDAGCVLLDLNARGIDGARFRAIQRRDRALAWIPVVVLSSRGDAAEVAQQLDAAAWLRKPFDLGQLRKTVASVLDGVPRAAHR